ncbi:potassium channel family protein [Nocardia sp. NPDC050710]|uniref:potassium channel family protein n=1 Tax=Nocardia sp. NPDC050710 TaxID=3157220 RepID=UPI0033D2099E
MVFRDSTRNLSKDARVYLLLRAVLRPVGTTSMLLAAYFLLPFNRIDDLGAASLVFGVLAVVGVVYVWQIRQVLHAEYAGVRAVEASAVTMGVYLVGYATTYFLLSDARPDDFSEALTRLDALYFTLTVFSTVGFGDIVATEQTSRAVVSVQILGNLILISLGIRLLTASVRSRRATTHAQQPESDDRPE